MNLNSVIKSIILNDSHPWFKAVFDQYYKNNMFLNFLVLSYYKLMKKSSLNILINILYGFLSAGRFGIRSHSKLLFCAFSENEKSEINSFINKYSIKNPTGLSKSLLNIFNIKYTLKVCLKIRKVYRILKMLKNNDILVQLRASEALFLYLKLKEEFTNNLPEIVLLSTNSRSYSLVLNSLSFQLNKKTIFLDHGHYMLNLNYMKLDLIIFNSKLNQELFDQSPAKYKKALIKQNKFNKIQLVKDPKLGVFLPCVYRAEFIEKANKMNLYLRFHPQDLITNTKNKNTFEYDMKQVDIGISGSSGVLIDFLINGKAAVYIKEIDEFPQQALNYVELGLIPMYEKLEDLNVSEIIKFYQKEEFQKTFERLIGNSDYDTESVEKFLGIKFNSPCH